MRGAHVADIEISQFRSEVTRAAKLYVDKAGKRISEKGLRMKDLWGP